MGQISHFFGELWTRLSVVGLTEGRCFDLPINQGDLGDAMGLSSVHVNRCLMTLRRNGLLEWTGGRVTILDWNELQTLAEFAPNILTSISALGNSSGRASPRTSVEAHSSARARRR